MPKSNNFDSVGFALFPSFVVEEELQKLASALAPFRLVKSVAGIRNLLSRCSHIREFATSGAAYQLATELLGSAPRPVRGILFDKTPDANWYVTWHQDLSIPVSAKVETPGYGPWSVKDDIVHVQPPAEILEQMVSLRIHLDDCGADNGAIKFIAGSHLDGILAADEIRQWRERQNEIICPAQCGDVIAMRPLILHASSGSKIPQQRRVLHLEYSAATLPSHLDWAMA